MFNEINVNTLKAFNQMIKEKILPATQKEQAKLFGIHETTLNGWTNNNNFPEYAKVIMNLLVQNFELEKSNSEFFDASVELLPVEIDSKVHLIKLSRNFSAVYPSFYKAEHLCMCNDADNAAYILDNMN